MKHGIILTSLCLCALTSFAAFDTPEATVAALSKLGTPGSKTSLAEFLPASYQKDMTDVLHLSASKMDPEIWTGATDLLSFAGKTIAPKAAFLVPEATPEADRAEVEKSLSLGLNSLSTVFASDAVKLDNLKKTTSIGLFDSLVSVVVPVAGKDLNDPKAAEVKSSTKLENGDVKLTFAENAMSSTFGDGSEDNSVTFRKVENCWVPVEMAESWTESVGQVKEALGRMDFTSTEGQQLKSQLLMAIPMLKMGVTGMGAAQTKEEFNNKAGMSIMPLMMLGGGGM